MYRYRMGKGSSGISILLFIAALILIVVGISVLTRPDNTASTPATAGGVSQPSFTQTIRKGWDSSMASMQRLWQLLTHQETDTLQGSGDDLDADAEEDTDGQPVQVDVVQQVAPTAFVPIGADVQVLLYSTHTHEAFTKIDGDNYQETAQWRTDNNDFNIVKVGEALAQELSTRYGIGVVQDKTDTEIPVLATSYSRSLQVAKKNIAEYPEAQIIIDLHRDAYNTNINPNTLDINGTQAARVMFVIGTGEGQTGAGFAQRPDWKSNLALAQTIENNLKTIHPQLSRGISVKNGRYNQHLSKGCVLIEVGNNKNTLDEVLATVPLLAQAIAKTLEGMPTAAAPASAAAATTPDTSQAPSIGVTAAPQPVIIEQIADDTATPSNPAPPTPSPSPSPTPGSSGFGTATPTAATTWFPYPR